MTLERVCGTGGYSGPQPGDPDNNSILTATPAFGGIDLNWTYPETNPHAVAHVNIYRSTAGTAGTAQKIASIGGSFYYDRTAELSATPIEYFYWIEIVSVNGTVNDWIGPSSATQRQPVGDIIESLTAKIDRDVLAGALKEELDRIGENKLAVDQALIDQAANDEALGAAIEQVSAHSDTTRAMMEEETLARVTALDAFVTTVNSVEASLGDTIAGVQQTMSSQVQGELLLRNGSFAMGTLEGWSGWTGVELLARDAGAASVKMQEAPSLYMASFPDNGHDAVRELRGEWFPVTEGQAYVTRLDAAGVGIADMSLSLSLVVEWRNDGTGVTTEESQATLITIDAPGWDRMPVFRAIPPAGATSGRVVLRRATGGKGQLLVTNVVGHKADSSFEAVYTAQVQANGLVGGFGLYNDGTTVDAGFDVDRFWVGRTQANKRKPFIIDEDDDGNQVTYIDTAMIREATIQEGQLGPITIGKLSREDGTPITTVGGLIRADALDVGNLDVRSATRFSGDVFSNNYESGVSGWALLQNGYAELNEAMIRGNLEVQSITVNGNSPFGALQVSGGNKSGNAESMEGSTGARSFSSTLDESSVVNEMPAGSRLSMTIYPRAAGTYNYRGSWQTSNTYQGTGDSGSHTTYSNHYGGGNWNLKVRVRIYVDTDLVLDETDTISSGSFDQSNGGASVTASKYNSGHTAEYTYPEYKDVSVVRAIVTISGSFNTWGDNGTYSKGELSLDGNNILTGDVFRLG